MFITDCNEACKLLSFLSKLYLYFLACFYELLFHCLENFHVYEFEIKLNSLETSEHKVVTLDHKENTNEILTQM